MLYCIQSVIMLAISYALGLALFCLGAICLLRWKKFRSWAVKATLSWCGDVTSAIVSADEDSAYKEEP